MYLFLFLIPVAYSAITTSDPIITSWKQSAGTYSYNVLTDITAVYYTSSYVYIKAQGIPSYTIGPWSANPNTPSGQNYIFVFPASPTATSGTKFDIKTFLGAVGVWSNGMTIYNAYDGFSYNSLGIWNRNALVWEGVSFDDCYGHPDGSGVYHNHVVPKCLFDATDSTKHSPIVGYSFDGYPIYGPYGYTTASDSTSAIKRMTTSYATRSITQRRSLPNGTVLTSGQYGPDVDTTYAIGSYMEDYVYTDGSGDLDECNGRTSVTPEYPGGTYAYFTTVDSTGYPEYPFVIGPCYYGSHILPNGAKTIPTSATKVYEVSAAYGVRSKTVIVPLLLALLIT